MQTLYHGIDIVEIARVRRAASRWGARFLRRVFTAGELFDCGFAGSTPRYESLAARWAAKEAVAKAFGVGLSGLGAGVASAEPFIRFHEIEVARGPAGSPALLLHGEAAAAARQRGISELAVSLSHTGEHALASVVGLAVRLD